MKTSVVYLHVVTPNEGYDTALDLQSGTYEDNAWRFIETYKKFPAGAEHELVIVFTNGLPPTPKLYEGLDCTFLFYKGDRWCTGVHQWAAQFLDSDFALFSSARSFFWKEGWLKRLVEVREKHGDGMYATMSSNEGMPHLRTNFYGIDPKVLRDFPQQVRDRGGTWTFESREWNISRQYVNEGKPSMLVTWDGEYSFPDWRKPDNIFRRGDQSNILVLDRHTEIFKHASDEERERLSKLSDGG
jgi:hypothetical protein